MRESRPKHLWEGVEMQSPIRQGSRRRTPTVRGDDGFTLIEVLIAVAVMSVGVAATMRVFGAAGRTTVRAQQHEVAVQQAQAEVDRLAAFSYGELALTSTPVSSSDPKNPGYKVAGTDFAVRSDLTEPFVLSPGAGATAKVEPGPQTFAVGAGGATTVGKLYRYVTWRNENCPLSLCEGEQNTKRVTVAVSLDPMVGSTAAPPVWVSTVVVDPDTAPPGSQAPPGGAPGGGDAVTADSFYLYDTPCGQGTRQPQTGSHPTRNTASAGSTAAESSVCEHPDPDHQPDLMGGSAPTGDSSTPVYEYSSDLAGDYLGGLAMVNAGSSCEHSYPAADANDPQGPSKWSVHAWSTGPMPVVYHLDGQVTLSLFTSTLAGASGSGRLCATLIDRTVTSGVPSDRVIGSAVYSLPSWPLSMRRVTFTFELNEAEDVPDGHRLVLALHLREESTHDVALLYDHPLYPSLLEVATPTPL
jgi:prepilin-type N-terminal cleavage/methylation domain-containing protein